MKNEGTQNVRGLVKTQWDKTPDIKKTTAHFWRRNNNNNH